MKVYNIGLGGQLGGQKNAVLGGQMAYYGIGVHGAVVLKRYGKLFFGCGVMP